MSQLGNNRPLDSTIGSRFAGSATLGITGHTREYGGSIWINTNGLNSSSTSSAAAAAAAASASAAAAAAATISAAAARAFAALRAAADASATRAAGDVSAAGGALFLIPPGDARDARAGTNDPPPSPEPEGPARYTVPSPSPLLPAPPVTPSADKDASTDWYEWLGGVPGGTSPATGDPVATLDPSSDEKYLSMGEKMAPQVVPSSLRVGWVVGVGGFCCRPGGAGWTALPPPRTRGVRARESRVSWG